MREEVKMVGMTFIKEPHMTSVELDGEVYLRPEPDNKFDKNGLAVAVYCDHEGGQVRIGYLPAQKTGDVARQKAVYESAETGKKIYAYAEEYGYKDGRFHWCILVISDKKIASFSAPKKDTAKNPSDVEITSSKYVIKGKEYRRLTHLLGTYEPDGKDGSDRLTKWACDHGSYDADKKDLTSLGDSGTAMHDAIEKWIGGDETVQVPQGFLNWWEKFQPEVVDVECRVTDDDIMVAGTYDLLCYIIIKGVRMLVAVDWKSSKNVRKKHKLQVGWYAHRADADEGWVVWFGGSQKQGYGCSRIDEETCSRRAMQVNLLAELQELE